MTESAESPLSWEPWEGAPPPRGPAGEPMTGDALCKWVRERTDTVLLGMSFGKDSLGAFLRLREHFDLDKIIGYHLYLIPGMSFEDQSLAYYREALGIRILNLPNRSLFRMLNYGIDQPPTHLPVIWGAELPDVEYRDIYYHIADECGVLDRRPWVAQGVRAADSPIRRIAIQKYGPHNLAERTFYPVWDWKKAELRAALVASGIQLPVDYRLFGRTFDGTDVRFSRPLREHYPADYRRMLDWFPLSDTDELRRELVDGAPYTP